MASVIVSLFLPYLHLPEQDNVSEGYEIDFNLAVLESNIINKVAKEENIKKTIVYSTAKNILNGKSREDTQRRLKEEEYYIIDLLAEELNEAIADMQEMGKLEKRDYSFSEMIKLSISVIDHMKQDIISSCLLIFSMIMTVILSIASGLNMGISKN